METTERSEDGFCEQTQARGERELAGYIDELISATIARAAAVHSSAPTDVLEGSPTLSEQSAGTWNGDVLSTEEAASPGGGPGPVRKPSSRANRASMSEELLALFRPTDRLPAQIRPAAKTSDPTTAGKPATALTGPTSFLRRFLERIAIPHDPVPSGFPELDDRLAGGFGPGLHLISGRRGTGKTSFLESVAWEAVASRRPVLYHAFKEGGEGVWRRLVATLGAILGRPVPPLYALRTGTVGASDLETLARLDLHLQTLVLPYLSLVEATPASAESLNVLIGDIHTRVREARRRHGKDALVLFDDLERLLLLTSTRPRAAALAHLGDTLISESVPGLLAVAVEDKFDCELDRLPAQSTLLLAAASTSSDDALRMVDLEVRANLRTGWTGTLPLVLDRRCGLFASAPAHAHPAQ